MFTLIRSFLIFEAYYFSGTFLIFFSICAAGIAFIYAMVPETKGRTLEDIQASLTDFVQWVSDSHVHWGL